MTPAQKAAEMIAKFGEFTLDGVLLPGHEDAKKCALIAVEEVIKVCPYMDSQNPETVEQGNSPEYYFIDFWAEVIK